MTGGPPLLRGSAGRVARLVAGAALYGYAIGSIHSPWLARWNLAKFPILLLGTTVICAAAYHVTALFLTRNASFADLWDFALDTFHDTALLLASLAPVAFFLAHVVEQPTHNSLEEYPLFLGLNVLFIALAGCLALVRRALAIRRRLALSTPRAALLVVAWLGLTLFVGGQAAWFLRPYFGIRAMDSMPVIDGARADYRGARSFYDAVWNLFDSPPLPDSYWKRPR